MGKIKLALIITLSVLIGVFIGGNLFSKSIGRSFMAVTSCKDRCFNTNEMMGLLASAGIQNLGGILPYVVYETDYTLVFDIQYPYPPDKIHYVIFTKKDIRDVSQLTEEDKQYLSNVYAVIGKIVRDNQYRDYMVITNGSGYQEVAYLHFHLVADRDGKK